MPARRYVVVIEWQDIHRDCDCDADEVQVAAGSAASAIAAARKKWASTIGAEHPYIRIERAWILSPGPLGRVACAK